MTDQHGVGPQHDPRASLRGDPVAEVSEDESFHLLSDPVCQAIGAVDPGLVPHFGDVDHAVSGVQCPMARSLIRFDEQRVHLRICFVHHGKT